MPHTEFYFALPRLLAQWSGREVECSERNWIEANIAGGLVHFVAYAFAFQIFLLGLPAWQQILWCIPLAFFVWIFWLVVLYLNSLVIDLLRLCGLTSDLPNRRVQSFLILGLDTLFAIRLVMVGSWPGLVGAIWFAAVALNLLAAIVLAFSDAPYPTTK